MARNCFAASMGCKKEGHVPNYITTSATAKIRTKLKRRCALLLTDSIDHNGQGEGGGGRGLLNYVLYGDKAPPPGLTP